MSDTVPIKNYSDVLTIKYNLEDEDRLLDLSTPNKFITQQGIELLEYDFLLSANDVRVKNYTANFLTSPKREDQIFDLIIPEPLDNSTSTTLQWGYRLDEVHLSASSYLTIDKNLSSLSSLAYFSPLSTTKDTLSAQTFNITFSSAYGDEICQIYTFDGLYKKYLVQHNNYERSFPQIIFDTLTGSDTNRTIFNVVRDSSTNRLKLFFNNDTTTVGTQEEMTDNRTSIITGGGNRYILPAGTSSGTLRSGDTVEPLTARQNLATSEILSANVLYSDLIRNTNYYEQSNNFVYYTTSGVNIDTTKTLSGLEYNFLMYNPYETNTINNETGEINARINYFNLKNQISPVNSVNKNLPFEKPQQQRYYNAILNDPTSETSSEGLKLGYNFYTANFIFKPDSVTKFKIPDNLGPYNQINLNDSDLQKSGAFAAISPYFSDKIYKNVNPDEGVTVNENNGNLLCSWLYDNGNGGEWFDRYLNPRLSADNVFFALSGNLNPVNTNSDKSLLRLDGFTDPLSTNNVYSRMLDDTGNFAIIDGKPAWEFNSVQVRYVSAIGTQQWQISSVDPNNIGTYAFKLGETDDPPSTGYTLGGTFGPITPAGTPRISFDFPVNTWTDLRQLTLGPNLTSMPYIDIPSTQVLEPSATYYYQRIGNKHINKMITAQSDKQVKKNFNPIDGNTGIVAVSSSTLVFDGSAYDRFSIPPSNVTGINLSFSIDTPSMEKFKAYQLIGNLYNTGIGIIKNFYYTPFIYFAHKKSVYLYDTDFNLKREIEIFNVVEIKDILYITQAGDFVAIVVTDFPDPTDPTNPALSEDRLIRVSFNGDVQVINTGSGLDPLFAEFGAAAQSRYIYNVGPKAVFKSAATTPGGNGGTPIDIDLLSLEEKNESSDDKATGRFGEISIIRRNNDSEFACLSGQRGVNVNDTIAASISGDNCILFKDFSQLETGHKDGSGNPITPFLGKTIVAFFSPDKIWDINCFDEKIYVQTGASGSSPKLKVLSTERELLSTIDLSSDAVSGCKIDFVSENYEIKPIAISRDVNENLIVDKITTESAGVSSYFVESYNLPISSTDMGYHFGNSEPTTFDAANTSQRFGYKMNPTAIHYVNNTFKNVENKLNVITRFDNEFTKVSDPRIWDQTAIDWDVAQSGLWTFNYAQGQNELSDEATLTTLSSFEGGLGCFSLNLDLIAGNAEIYIGGTLQASYEIKSGQKPLKNYLNNGFFVGIPNLDEQPVIEIVTNQILTALNGSIKDLYAYGIQLRSDLIKYHCLINATIDDIIYDVTVGVRNNIETINKMFTYNIPGHVSNRAVIRISDGNLDENDAEILATELTGRLGKYLPININSIEYDFAVGNSFTGSIVKNLLI